MNAPVAFDPATLRIASPDREKLGALFKVLGFRSLTAEFTSEATAEGAPAPPPEPGLEPSLGTYRTILTRQDLEAAVAAARRAPRIAVDTETNAQDPMRAKLVGISLCVAPGEAAYIPLAHRYPGAPDQLDRDAVLARLKPWLESDAPKVGHNLKFDAHVFANSGLTLRGCLLARIAHTLFA